MASHVYQVGEFIRIKRADGHRIDQPLDQDNGRFGKILRRYTAATQILLAIWWVGFDHGETEPIAEDWLEPETNG